MPTRTIVFNIYTDTGGATAWGPGNSTPAFPSGYTLLADAPRISGGLFTKFAGGANTIILDDTVLAGDVIEAEVDLGAVTSDSEGPCICDPSGVGWQLLSNSSNGTRLFNMTTGGVLGTQVTGAGAAMASNSICRLRYTQSTDTMEVFDDGVLNRTWTGVTSANTNWRAGAFVRNAGQLVSLSSIYTASQTVTSINGGNDIEVGEIGVPAVLTGFGGAITSITTNQTGMTVSNITGTTNAPVFDLSDWAEAGAYPELPVNTSFTFNYLAESATSSETVTFPTGWVKQTFSAAIIDNDRYFGYIFDDAGHTVEGAVLYYDPAPIPGLVINPDSSWEPVADGGTFDAWLRPSTGPSAGNMYYFELTIQEDNTATGRGITAVGLTMTGITVRGITAVGL